MAEDPDHQVQERPRLHRTSQLLQAFSSPDSYGLVVVRTAAGRSRWPRSPRAWSFLQWVGRCSAASSRASRSASCATSACWSRTS